MHTLQKEDRGVYLIHARGSHDTEVYVATDQAEVDARVRELTTDGLECDVYLAYKLVQTT